MGESSRIGVRSGIAPLWYVTNGEIVVGPVDTNLLVRGVAAGRVHDECSVWREPWTMWRPIGAVREVIALRAAQDRLGESWQPSRTWSAPPSSAVSNASRWIARAADEDEVVSLTLQAIALETRATVGLAHRPERAMGPLETRSVVGTGASDRLGFGVEATDDAIRLARMGATIIDEPGTSRAGFASMVRLGASGGVALAPIFYGPRLVAILELGKADHPFRKSDRSLLRAVTRAASLEIASHA